MRELFSWSQRVQICAFQAGICGVGRQLIPADLVYLAVEVRYAALPRGPQLLASSGVQVARLATLDCALCWVLS